MKYVLDGNVALKWVLPGSDSGKAIRPRNEYSNGIQELIAPDIFPSEIANGLAFAERQNRIRAGESTIFLNDVLSAAWRCIPPHRCSFALWISRFPRWPGCWLLDAGSGFSARDGRLLKGVSLTCPRQAVGMAPSTRRLSFIVLH